MKKVSSIELPARLDQLHPFMEFAVSFASERGFAGRTLQNIELCLEEALVNIFSYAYKNTAGRAGVECLFEGGVLTIKVTDSGFPFDPLDVHSPDVHANMAANRIGGYGIVLIKKLTDDVRYTRENDKNILTLVFVKHDGPEKSPVSSS